MHIRSERARCEWDRVRENKEASLYERDGGRQRQRDIERTFAVEV